MTPAPGRKAPNARQRAFGGNLDMREATTPGPPVRRVPLWSAAVERLNREPLVMEPYRCPLPGNVAFERKPNGVK